MCIKVIECTGVSTAASWFRFHFWHDTIRLAFVSYETLVPSILPSSLPFSWYCIFNFADSGKVVPSNSCLLDTIANQSTINLLSFSLSLGWTRVLILCFPCNTTWKFLCNDCWQTEQLLRLWAHKFSMRNGQICCYVKRTTWNWPSFLYELMNIAMLSCVSLRYIAHKEPTDQQNMLFGSWMLMQIDSLKWINCECRFLCLIPLTQFIYLNDKVNGFCPEQILFFAPDFNAVFILMRMLGNFTGNKHFLYASGAQYRFVLSWKCA